MELFLVQIVVVGLLLYVVAKIVPGMAVDGVGHALLAGLVLGIVNALVPGLHVRGFGAALIGALLLSVLSFGATLIL